ncbi:MAG: hypothetical protein OXG25_15375 [Gammaproteobacteria bacterium]|nr:hypothetical protein [Gammaproteobacteria bacterium]
MEDDGLGHSELKESYICVISHPHVRYEDDRWFISIVFEGRFARHAIDTIFDDRLGWTVTLVTVLTQVQRS